MLDLWFRASVRGVLGLGSVGLELVRVRVNVRVRG